MNLPSRRFQLNKVYLAFYKKKRKIIDFQSFYYRIFDDFTRLVTGGIYSHCELAIENLGEYNCYSSSNRDGGVRKKRMELPLEDWDLIEITYLVNVRDIVDFYKKTQGKKYDFIGLMSPVLGNLHDDDKYFCSEWCAEAIGLIFPNKYSPSSLYKYLRKML